MKMSIIVPNRTQKRRLGTKICIRHGERLQSDPFGERSGRRPANLALDDAPAVVGGVALRGRQEKYIVQGAGPSRTTFTSKHVPRRSPPRIGLPLNFVQIPEFI